MFNAFHTLSESIGSESFFSLACPLIKSDPSYAISNSRFISFYSSRQALINCFDQLQLNPSLNIENHHHLKDHPHYLVSLSHTENIGAAFVMKESQGFQSIGIDVERIDRKIKNGIEKFFVTPHDLDPISLLHLWTAKEAAFKAIWPVLNEKISKTLVLTDIWVKKDRFGLDIPGFEHLNGAITHFQKTLQTENENISVLVCLATLS